MGVNGNLLMWCAALGAVTAAGCGNEPGARVTLEGSRYDADGACFGPREPAGPVPFSGDPICGAALTHALDPDGACWLFPSTCLPEGFVAVGDALAVECRQTFRSCAEPDAPVSCAERHIVVCEWGEACVLTGGPHYKPEADCFDAEPSPLACVEAGQSCPPVVTPALDADGRCFAFGGCLPPGYTPAPPEHPCRLALGRTCGG